MFYKTFDAIKYKTELTGLHLVFGHVKLHGFVLFGLQGLTYKGFDDRNGLDQADDAVVLIFPIGAHSSPKTTQFFGLQLADVKINRDDAQTHEAHVEIGVEHKYQRYQ